MKNHVALPLHNDTTRALLIDGPHYDGWTIYIPCLMSDGRKLRLPVAAQEEFGIHIRKQPVLLITDHSEPEVALVNIHLKRFYPVKNLMLDTPHFHIDDVAVIDLSSDTEWSSSNSTRTGRIAYNYRHGRDKSLISGKPIAELRYSEHAIHHPYLDQIDQSTLDEAYQAMGKIQESWKNLFMDHINGRLTMELPGIDTFIKYNPEPGEKLPLLYCRYMHTEAGKGLWSDAPDPGYPALIAARRQELVQFIEMLSGMAALVSEDIEFTYDGATPSVTFRHKDKTLDLRVNDLPMIGRFLVVDPSKEDFDSKLTTFETLTLAINSITTRLTQ